MNIAQIEKIYNDRGLEAATATAKASQNPALVRWVEGKRPETEAERRQRLGKTEYRRRNGVLARQAGNRRRRAEENRARAKGAGAGKKR